MTKNQGNGNNGGNADDTSDRRGFADTNSNKQREIASEGGRAAHGSVNGQRGGASEQHAEAGRQSHKND